MKKFLAIYNAPAEAMAAMSTMTPEQAAEGMKAWYAWKEKCGDAIIDFGAPLAPGQNINGGGDWSASAMKVSGYSVLQSESLEKAQALFDGHPHLSWAPGTSIDLHEFASM